jgi:hypothetical protein
MTQPRPRLNPARLAALEAGGWRAYYDRDWLKLITLMVQLNQEQFGIPFPLSLVAAFHVARGSVAWAPIDHDVNAVITHFHRFYRMAHRWSNLPFDPRRAAELEIRYWVEHRRLIGNPDKTSFVEAMTELHAQLFGRPPSRLRESAEWRVKANNTVDVITGKLSQDPAADWSKLESELVECWLSVERELERAV